VADYAYHFYDFSTRERIDTLPMENVAFGWELGGVGTLSGELPLYADALAASRVRDATLAYRTKVFVERGSQLVWGGWIHEEPSYDSSSGRLTVTAEESLGYFARRFLPTLSFTGQDQLAIARALITALQSQPGGDMWVTLDPSVTSGVLRDRTYNAFDRTPGLQALTQLSEVIDGFEVAVQCIWDGSLEPLETLLLGYPRLGRALAASGLVWEFDRFMASEQSLESFTWASTGTPMATKCYADTETDDGVQLTAMAERPDLVAGGYPLMEYSESFDGIQNISTLQAHADALQEFRAAPRIAATATAKAQPGLEIGDFQIGDDVLCRISDHRFPPGEDGAPGFLGYLRIVGCDVTPGVDGAETYTFTLADLVTWE
jgi:hypothetical protein